MWATLASMGIRVAGGVTRGVLNATTDTDIGRKRKSNQSAGETDHEYRTRVAKGMANDGMVESTLAAGVSVGKAVKDVGSAFFSKGVPTSIPQLIASTGKAAIAVGGAITKGVLSYKKHSKDGKREGFDRQEFEGAAGLRSSGGTADRDTGEQEAGPNTGLMIADAVLGAANQGINALSNNSGNKAAEPKTPAEDLASGGMTNTNLMEGQNQQPMMTSGYIGEDLEGVGTSKRRKSMYAQGGASKQGSKQGFGWV